MKNKQLLIGIGLMLLSSCMTCVGQLMWKLAAADTNLIYYIIGIGLYGLGALVMMVALRFGDLSVLHPMLSFGFIASVFLGYYVLNEAITIKKIIGILCIIIGLIFMSIGGQKSNGESKV